MNQLKSLFIVLLLSVFSSQLNAQGLILKGGLTMAKVKINTNQESVKALTESNLGFHLSFGYELPINEFLYFEPGLMITTKGMKVKNTFNYLDEYKIENKMNLVYADVPMLFKLKYKLSETLYTYNALGPYVGVGITGKIKTKITANGQTEEDTTDVKWGESNENGVKRLDFGFSLGGGIEYNKISLGLSYNMGLVHINTNQEEDGGKIYHNLLQLSLGYRLVK